MKHLDISDLTADGTQSLPAQLRARRAEMMLTELEGVALRRICILLTADC